MRHLLALCFLCGCFLTAGAGTFTNESPAGMKVIWAVPTNVWPVDRIWSYKVIPQEFSEAVISNAMKIASFTMKDRKPAPKGWMPDGYKTLLFRNADETKYLMICPALGCIEYYDGNAEAKAVSAVKDVPEPVVGVPDLAEATRLGLIYARLLGIEVSHFARKAGSCDFDLHWEITTRGWMNQTTKQWITNTQGFGVDFTRCIDGIEMTGFGDVSVNFGNNAKLSQLKVSWRNLKPYQLLDKFITPDEIVASIQSGRVRLPRLAGWPLDEIKTLTITNATPRYSRKPGDEAMDFVSPALQLGAILDNGITNRHTWFQMGILPPK
jgi:hypothetical protein